LIVISQWFRRQGIGLGLAGLLLLAACDTTPTPTSIPPASTPTPAPATATVAPPTATVAPPATDTAIPPPTPSAAAPTAPPTTTTTRGGPTPGGTGWEHILTGSGDVRVLAQAPGTPGTLYAAGEKFYRSTDGGQTWTELTPGFAVSQIAVAPSAAQTLYAGTAEGCASGIPGDLRESTDGGATWATRTGGPADLDINPTDPTHLLGIRCDGVGRSTDSGQTWTKLPGTGVTNFDGRSLARGVNDRTVIYAAYLSEGGSLTLQRTSDDGRTWQTFPTDDVRGLTDLAVDPTDARRVYALTISGVLVSTDGGQTWTHQDKGLERAGNDISGNPLIVTNLIFDTGSASSAGTPPALYLGETGFERSARIRRWTGDQWVTVADLNTQTVRRLALVPGADGPALLAATEQGIFRLPLATLSPQGNAPTPAGTSGPAPAVGVWQLVSEQIKDLRVLRGSLTPGGPVYAGGNGVYRSTDGGQTWAAISDPFQVNEIAPAPSDPQVLYAGTGEACYGTIKPALYRSGNGGQSWLPIGAGPFRLAVSATDPNDLIGLQCNQFMHSRDGKTWQKTANGGVENSSGVFLARGVNDPATAYAVFASEGGTARVRRTTNSGTTWTTLPDPAAEVSNPQDIQVDPADAQHVYLVTGTGFFASADGGQTWNTHNSGLEATRPEPDGLYHLGRLALDTSSPPPAGATATLYLSSDPTGLDSAPGQIYRWNGQDAWVAAFDAPTPTGVGAFAFVPDPTHPALLAATGDAIYRLPLL
jgi:photosystem II stability/assembly factor-like uncharacterized protein